jgi:hypothetical protein
MEEATGIFYYDKEKKKKGLWALYYLFETSF